MPSVRLNLKYLNNSLGLLLQDVEMLRGKGASRAAEADMAALRKKLAAVQKLMAGECPEAQFRSFEVTEWPKPTPAPDPLAQSRKVPRKRTRKAR